MGDYSAFVARVKSGVRASDVERDLQKRGARSTVSDDDLGLVTGIMKAYAPGLGRLDVMDTEGIEAFATLSQRANTGREDDYCSWGDDG